VTRQDERRRQRDIGAALLIGAVVLAALLAAMVYGGWGRG
jgi:hypothetical protein